MIQRIKPKELYISLLRAATRRLFVDRAELQLVTDDAVAQLINQAKNPGIDSPRPHETAQSLASTLKTSVARIHACSSASLQTYPTSEMGNGLRWRYGALYGGIRLHQWTAIGTKQELHRATRSMDVIGDCAFSGLPMTLHVVEIGRQNRAGRFDSPWCRIFSDQKVARNWTFKPRGTGWKPIYFEDGKNDPQIWISLMERDGVKLLHDLKIELSPEHCEEVKQRYSRSTQAVHPHSRQAVSPSK